MGNENIKPDKNPSIYSKDGMVYKVDDDFLQIVGYKDCDIVSKSLKQLSILLKMNFQTCFDDIKDVESLYVFTNEDVPKGVSITCVSKIKGNEKLFYIEKDSNPFLGFILVNFANNGTNIEEGQAIYSYPSLICLKANRRYIESLDSLDLKCDSPVGTYHPYPKYLSEIVLMDSFYINEAEHTSLKGTKSYWDLNMRLIHGDANKMFLVSTLYDVTDRVIEKRLLQKQSVEMKIILDNVSDSINKVNKKGEFTYINKAAKNKLATYISDGKLIDDKQEYGFFKYNDINGNELDFEDTPIQKILRGETIVDEILIVSSHLPATYYQCNGVPVYDEEGNMDGGVLIYKDVKDIYKINEYYAFRQNIEDAFLRYASLSYEDFKVNYMNEAAITTAKRINPEIGSNYQFIGKSFFDFYHLPDMGKDELIKKIKESIEKKESYTVIQKVINEGKTMHIKTIFQPIHNEKNEVQRIEVVDADITDEIMANETMNQALKMQDEIFINTSHELKTPLNVIFAASQLLNLLLEKDNFEDIKDDIFNSNKIIIKNCYRLSRLINNILDVSKIESGFYKLNLSNYNIVELIDNIVQSVSEYTKSKGIKVIFDTEVEELPIALDAFKFDRIMLNLISNAIKFSSDDEIILIKLVKKDNNTVQISVVDNGVGIDEKELDRIFQKFVQLNKGLNRRSEGTGIGLSLVKSITQLHGGKVSVESTLGKGSTFTIELPIKTIDSEDINHIGNDYDDKVERIKYELSDIY